MDKKRLTPFAALTLDYSANATDGWCQILPAGSFGTPDGRPAEVPGNKWVLNALLAARVIADVQALRRDMLIDYEHQILTAQESGQPAPAAGWFKEIEWREGKGLFIKPEWTNKAADFIANKEYRYLSAVFTFDKETGAVGRLLHVALTNNPALDLEPVQLAALSARWVAPEKHPVNKEELIKLLGLAPDATDEQIKAALSAKVKDADQVAALTAQNKELTSALDKEPEVDPTKYVPKEVYDEQNKQLAALSAKSQSANVSQLLADARSAGKIITPAEEKYLTDLGNKDIAALTATLEARPAIAALTAQQTNGQKPAGTEEQESTAALTAEEQQAATLMGMTHAEFAAAKKETA